MNAALLSSLAGFLHLLIDSKEKWMKLLRMSYIKK